MNLGWIRKANRGQSSVHLGLLVEEIISSWSFSPSPFQSGRRIRSHCTSLALNAHPHAENEGLVDAFLLLTSEQLFPFPSSFPSLSSLPPRPSVSVPPSSPKEWASSILRHCLKLVLWMSTCWLNWWMDRVGQEQRSSLSRKSLKSCTAFEAHYQKREILLKRAIESTIKFLVIL